MGCSNSKSAVKAIQVTKEGVVTKSSAPVTLPTKDAIETAESFVNEATQHVEVIKDQTIKSTSAKSRDSGIDEMDLFEKADAIDREIAEFAAPNAVTDPVGPKTGSQDDCSLSSEEPQKFDAEVERLQSEAILKELENAGLIQASKFKKGGAAFEVDLGETRKPSLPPLAPMNRLPPRLERLKSQKKIKPNKDDLEAKIRNAEKRRAAKMERRKSKLALKLARDEENVLNMELNHTPIPPVTPLPAVTNDRIIPSAASSAFNRDDNVFDGSDISSLDSAPATPATTIGTPSF